MHLRNADNLPQTSTQAAEILNGCFNQRLCVRCLANIASTTLSRWQQESLNTNKTGSSHRSVQASLNASRGPLGKSFDSSP